MATAMIGDEEICAASTDLFARPHQILVESPPQHRGKRVAPQSLGSRGQLDLIVMGEIEGELRRGRVAVARLDLEATQHDFLQPRRIVRPQPARRYRIAPQPAAHAAHRLAFAEWPHAGREEVEQNAQCEQIAARIVADAAQLLRRHVGRRPERHPKLFLHQIGKLVVMGEAEIQQHGFAGRPEHDVARLDVEMDHVLAVKVVQRLRDFYADFGHLRIRQRKFGQPRVAKSCRGCTRSRCRAAARNRRPRCIWERARRSGAA